MSATEAPGALLLERPDADLIAAVRAGDLESYGELFARHVDAARRLARQLTRGSGDAEDLVSDAFAKVLEVLRRGGGPDEAFRAYLLTSVRRLHVDRARRGGRVQPTDDIAAHDAGVPFTDTAVAGFDNEAAAEAFASLPERWQLVLWHTEVEGAKPADVAPLLGISPNSVAALAYRAREGLREAFLSAHAARTDDEACRRTQGLLGSYVRGNASRRDGGKVEEHLEGCRRCAGIYLELVEVNSGLGALIGPLLLGGAAAAYAGSATAATVAASGTAAGWTGWLLAIPGRARDLAMAHLPATAAAGVATAVVGGGVVAGVARSPEPEPPARAETSLAGPATPDASSPDPVSSGDPDGRSSGAGRDDEDAPTTDDGTDVLPAVEVPGEELPPEAEVPVEPPVEEPEPAPDPQPQPEPQHEPQPQPEPQPVPQPDPQPAPPPMRAEGRAETVLGLTFRVVLDVMDLPPDATGQVRLTSDRPLVALTLDRRCAGLALGPATCSLGEGAYSFRAVPLPGLRTTLTFTVTTDAGETRTVRVPLA